jgi:hypothetical protein
LQQTRHTAAAPLNVCRYTDDELNQST